MRRRSGWSYSGALLALALAAPGAQAQDKIRFQTDWIPSGEHAMYYGGLEKGIFREEGLDVTITRGYGSGDTVAKMAGGAMDASIADLGALMIARARQNVPLKAVATLYTHSPHSLFVLKSSGITEFKGLEGKKIGITPGNSHRLYFPRVAERAGTDPNKIVWVNMDGAAMAAQLIAKNLDAAPFFSIHHYYQNKAALKAGEEIAVLPFVKVGFAIYATGIVLPEKIIKEQPDVMRRFVKAMQRAHAWARDNPVEACTLHRKRHPEVEQDDCEGSLRAVLAFVWNEHEKQHGFGRYEKERLAFTWQVVAESQDIDPKSADPAGIFDLSLLPPRAGN